MSKKKDFGEVVTIRKPGGAPPSIGGAPLQGHTITHPVTQVKPRPEVRDIPLELIDPDPNQPRKVFQDIEGLADSIASKGVLQPVKLKRVGERFQLIYGERRFRACKLLNLETIPAIVLDAVEHTKEISLIENIQRENLLPEEIAPAVVEILPAYEKKEDLAKTLGKHPAFISRCIKISNFLGNNKASELLTHLREKGQVIGFEILYEASARDTLDEGLALLEKYAQGITPNRESVRQAVKKTKPSWNQRKLITYLRSTRKKLNFDFIGVVPVEEPSSLANEIDQTLQEFDSAITALRKMRAKLPS